jgi:hypothetical protein
MVAAWNVTASLHRAHIVTLSGRRNTTWRRTASQKGRRCVWRSVVIVSIFCHGRYVAAMCRLSANGILAIMALAIMRRGEALGS